MTEQKTKSRKRYYVGTARRRAADTKALRRFNKEYGYDKTLVEYSEMVREVTALLEEELLAGAMFKLPRQMGLMFIRLRKRKSGPDASRQVAFGMTVLARQKDPNADVVYVRNDRPSAKLVWFKTDIKVTNKAYFVFRPVRNLKHKIRDAILANKSYIHLNDSKENFHRKGDPGSPNGSGVS